MPTVAEIADYLNDFAPTRTAAEWDNVGLLLGERATTVARILTCLTVTPEVVAEAVRDGVNLIVTHHPMLFRPVQKLTDANAESVQVPHWMEPEEGVTLKAFRSKLPEIMVVPLAENAGANTSASVTERARGACTLWRASGRRHGPRPNGGTGRNRCCE